MNDSITVTPLQIGPIFSTAWRVLSKNPGLMFIVFAAYIPIAVIDALSDFFSSEYIFWGAFLLVSIISTSLSGMLVHGVLRIMDGEEPNLSDSVARGLAWVLSAFLVSLLGTAIVLLGLVALIIPGVILSCALAVSLEACVAEGLDPVDSLKRSAELTKGNRMQIFGLSLALTFLSVILSAAAELIAGLFTDNQTIALSLGYILSMPVYAYTSVAYIVLYRFLANSGSGLGSERFSQIFN